MTGLGKTRTWNSRCIKQLSAVVGIFHRVVRDQQPNSDITVTLTLPRFVIGQCISTFQEIKDGMAGKKHHDDPHSPLLPRTDVALLGDSERHYKKVPTV